MGILGNNIPILQVLDCSLRLFAVPFSIASFWLTLTLQQKNSDYGDIKFSNFTGLKYLAIISAIAAGYAIVGAVCLWIKIIVSKAWLFFVSDQIVAYLMVTSMASLWEIIELAYEGDQKVTWSEACSSYGIFCLKLKLILVLHIIALCCFLILALISAYRLFRRYDPPFVPSNAAGEGKD